MIIANDLHKSFKTKTGKVTAVDGVSFTAHDGQITGLLGPNGAGKTTTLRMLYTLMTPDRGRVLVDGIDAARDPEAVRRSQPALPTELMVAYVYDRIARHNPVSFFGMVNVLEGTSIALATRAASAIRGSLELPPTAFSYLNSHGSLDLEHMRFFEDLMNRLDTDEDREVAEGDVIGVDIQNVEGAGHLAAENRTVTLNGMQLPAELQEAIVGMKPCTKVL